MASESFNDGPIVRWLVVLAVKIRTHRYVRRLWKNSIKLPSFGKLCIKVTPSDHLAEASTLMFIAQHTSIPVPKVYSAFKHKDATYIVMRKIDGQPAVRSWTQRPQHSKEHILKQLRDMIGELRSITPAPGTCIGNVDGGPFRDVRLPTSLFWGPFTTVRDFHEALVNSHNLDKDYPDLPDDVRTLFELYRQAPEKLVFTHADLSSLNILVKGDDVAGIVDWETAGWFPPYWEYVCAWNVNPSNFFWQDEVDKFLTPMPRALEMDRIRREYFGDT